MQALEKRENHVLLRVRVQPRASRNALSRAADGRLRVTLTAPPVDGAANKAVCAFVAGCLKLPKSAVTVVAGEKSRDKTLRIDSADLEMMNRLLA